MKTIIQENAGAVIERPLLRTIKFQPKNKRTGCVYLQNKSKKYVALGPQHNKKQKYLGTFKSEGEAREVRASLGFLAELRTWF